MAHTIDYKCTACGDCLPLCPLKCIHEGDIYKIDRDLCIDCSVCKTVCKNDAIFSDMYFIKADKKKRNK